MKADSVNDIKDSKLRNTVIMAQDSWNNGVPFSKAIIDSSGFCKADVGEVTDYMLELAKEKMKE
jgi:hypothetical protein